MKNKLFNFYKGWKKNSVILKLFSILSTLLFCISLISSILISINSDVASLNMAFSYEGFDNFLTIYSFPLKSFAGFLALFTIYVTLKRTYAAEKQIEIALEQNRISNYFKYRDEFVKHMEAGSFYKYYLFYVDEKGRPQEIFYSLFNYCYGSILDFDNKIKPGVINEIHSFFKEIRNTPDMEVFNSKLTSVEILRNFYTYFSKLIKPERDNFGYLTSELANLFIIKECANHKYDDEEEELLLLEMMGFYFRISLFEQIAEFAGLDIKTFAHRFWFTCSTILLKLQITNPWDRIDPRS